MNTQHITVDRFKSLAPEKFSFLEHRGFHRESVAELTSPTASTLVYLGRYVGFIVSFDVRDQCVDVQVVRVRDGKMHTRIDGGYSSDLFVHLVEHEGYRGKPVQSAQHRGDGGSPDDLQAMLDRWAVLIQDVGGSLLRDQPGSLPG